MNVNANPCTSTARRENVDPKRIKDATLDFNSRLLCATYWKLIQLNVKDEGKGLIVKI